MEAAGRGPGTLATDRSKATGPRLPISFGVGAPLGLAKLVIAWALSGEGGFILLAATSLVEAVFWSILLGRRFREAGVGEGALVFPLAGFAYATIPALVVGAGLDVFPFADSTVWRAACLLAFCASVSWWAFAALVPPAVVGEAERSVKAMVDGLSPTRIGIRLFTALGASLAGFYAWNFTSSGASSALSDTSRADLLSLAETGKTWLVQYAFLAWGMVLALLLSGARARASLTRASRLAAAAIVAAWLAVYLTAGNRRELVNFLVFALILAVGYGQRKRVLAAIAVLVPAGLVLGVVRAQVGDGDEVQVAALNAFGEFLFPHFPLMHNIETAAPLAHGATYLRLPFYVLPSMGMWTKEETLARTFAQTYAEGVMGFAYTPLAEGYLNFGASAVVLIPVALSLALRATAGWASRVPLAFLVLLAMSLDVNRGEFVGIVTQYGLLLALVHGLLAVAQARTGGDVA